ncbi:hypothetical protein HPB48_014950 [Haemaphysalis longicornis]|uniref:Uncharacterized protein n=1 Tax=Haemaphysalis longicornis TaxID=44386 RepID=A0A9J6FGC1_HAELO|nr:hypothetical protein HPB48_014950 [Haemaphysalis longicornis]
METLNLPPRRHALTLIECLSCSGVTQILKCTLLVCLAGFHRALLARSQPSLLPGCRGVELGQASVVDGLAAIEVCKAADEAAPEGLLIPLKPMTSLMVFPLITYMPHWNVPSMGQEFNSPP